MCALDITQLDRQKLDLIAAAKYSEFKDTEKHRSGKETEWLQSLRQSKGIHDPEVQSKFTANESQIYSQYTRSKEVPLRSKLNQHLLPEKEKNWEVTATPKPRVGEQQLQAIIEPLIQQDESGQPIFPSEREIDEAIYKFTQERSGNMSRTINDQLTECKYRDEEKKQIKEGIQYGTGLTKGPLTIPYTEPETVFVEETGIMSKAADFMRRALMGGGRPAGNWIQQEVQKYRPEGEHVSLWRWFPDMSTPDIKKCNFAYELHSMTKPEMRKLADREDFFGDVILDILTRLPRGNYVTRAWEAQLAVLDPQTGTTTFKVDANTTVTASSGGTPDTKNYEVVEMNGYIDGTDLAQAGIIAEDQANLEYFCNLWICDGKTIKIMPWPKDVIASVAQYYHPFYYEKDETSIFGTGLPRIIRDRQLAMNACERHMLGHAAWLEAPCGEVDMSIIHPDSITNAQNFGPNTFLGKLGYGNNAGKKILDVYDIADNLGSFISLAGFLASQGDREASLPASLFGTPSPRTGDESARGVSVRFENLLDFIKDLAKNYDDAKVSLVSGFYRWNMKFNPDENIKGDMEGKAIGSAAALIKDAIREEIGFIFQSLPEELKPYFKWEGVAKILAKTFTEDVEAVVRSQEEVDKMQAPAIEKQKILEDLQAMLLEMKTAYEKSKVDSMAAKTQKTLSEIPTNEAKVIQDIEKSKIEGVAAQVQIVKELIGEEEPGGSGQEK